MRIPRRFLGPIAGTVLMVGCAAAPAPSASLVASASPTATPSATSPSPSASATQASPSASPSTRSTEGDWIVFQTDVGAGNVIWIMRPDGSDAHAIAGSVPGDQTHPDWSPDGKRIVFSANNDLWIIGVDGTGAKKIQACGGMCDYSAWSPDGSSIAFSRYVAGPNAPSASTIEVLDLDTGKTRVVTSAKRPELVDVPRWSADGKRLVIGVDQFDDAGNETGSTIAVVDAAKGTRHDLLPFDSFAYYPDWNRRTNEVVYSIETRGYVADPAKAEPQAWDLFGIQPDGTGRRSITSVDGDMKLWQPSWTPDGARILADDVGGRDGRLIDPTSGDMTIVADLQSAVTHPRWRPTG
jgi:Tol biopolymer transport system component